jgi:hypothetical protein
MDAVPVLDKDTLQGAVMRLAMYVSSQQIPFV